MKHVFLALLVCCVAGHALGAERPSREARSRFTVAMAGTAITSGDLGAYTVRYGYSRDLTPRIGIDAAFGFSGGARFKVFGDVEGSDFVLLQTCDVEAYVNLARTPGFALRLEAGPGVMRWVGAYIISYHSVITSSGETQSYIVQEVDSHIALGVHGWLVALWRLPGPWVLGVRAGGTSYLSGELVWTGGVEAGVTWW